MKFSFAKNLARIRKTKGLSQEKLAQMAGVSRRTVAYYENEAENLHIESAFAIAKALNVKIEDLLNGGEAITNSNDVQIDSRSMEKIKLILSLPTQKRFIIYTIAEALAKHDSK